MELLVVEGGLSGRFVFLSSSDARLGAIYSHKEKGSIPRSASLQMIVLVQFEFGHIGNHKHFRIRHAMLLFSMLC